MLVFPSDTPLSSTSKIVVPVPRPSKTVRMVHPDDVNVQGPPFVPRGSLLLKLLQPKRHGVTYSGTAPPFSNSCHFPLIFEVMSPA
jgi:hypothetical protein